MILLERIRSIFTSAVLASYILLAVSLCIIIKHNILPLGTNGSLFAQPAAVSGESEITDFVSLYAAGLLNRDRLSSSTTIDIYDPFLLTQSVARVIAPMQPIEIYSIQYAPIFFFLITPLAYLDLYNAWLAWSIFMVVCIILAFIIILWDVLKKRPFLLLGIVPCLTNTPILNQLLIGQTTNFEILTTALSLRLLQKQNRFWAGLIAGTSLFKIQFAPISFIPGLCIGKGRFLCGYLSMIIAEGLLSIYVVGWNNIFNFLRTNYLCEIAHTYVGLNVPCFMTNFRSIVNSLPWIIPEADRLAIIIYLIVCLISLILWLMVYPRLQKISIYAFELLGSITIILQLIFSMHAFLYDYSFIIISCLWLYLWSTGSSLKTIRPKLLQFITTTTVILLPLITWLSLFQLSAEYIELWNQLRYFSICLLLLTLATLAIFVEFKNPTDDRQLREL